MNQHDEDYLLISTSGFFTFCGGDPATRPFIALLRTLTAVQRYGKHMSVNNIVPVNKFILCSLYYVAISFFGGGKMLRRTVVNLTRNESRCAV